MYGQLATKLMSFEEYLAYTDDSDARYELVDGELAPMSPPTILHVLIAELIRDLLKQEVARQGHPWLCLREVGVRTALRKSRIVDVCVIEAAQVEGRLGDAAVFEEPPLLAVEVVSPESSVRDYRYKRSEYAAIEIGEYWVVDPSSDKVTVFLLEQGLYEGAEFQGVQQIKSRLFPDLDVTADSLLKVQG